MKCSYCKKEMEENVSYCPNCGKEVKIRKNYKPLIIVGSFLLVIVALFAMMFATMFHYFNSYKPTISSLKDFVGNAENVGCQVIDVLETSPNQGLEYYYVTDQETCPYLMAYAKFKDDQLMYNFYRNLLSETNKVEGTARNDYNVNILNYIEHTTIGNEYKSVSVSNKTVLYIQTERKNKDTAKLIKETLGFKFEMDWTFLYFGVASFAIEMLLLVISFWKLFKKMGHQGWKIFIPIYNVVLLCEDVMGKKIYAFLFFIPIANLVFSLILSFHIAKVFGKSDGVQILSVFFPSFMIPLIALDESKYTSPSEIKKLEALNNVNKVHNSDNSNNNSNEIKEEKVIYPTIQSRLGNENIYQGQKGEERKSGWKVFLDVIKWILAILLFLLSIFGLDYEKILVSDVVFCAFLFVYALMICPLITKYTKRLKWYTANKGWIALVLVILMFILLGILP